MSASREKKQRQDLPLTAMTEKQRRDAKEAGRAKRNKIVYTIIGVIAVVLVAGLLFWNSNFFQNRTTAATVGDHNFTVGEVAYYYANARQQEIQMGQFYAQFGMDAPYDSTQSATEQIQDEASGKTYDQYFKEQALEALKQTTILCDQAKAENYALSEDGQKSADDALAEFKDGAAQYGASLSVYLKAVFGKHMTESTFKRVIHDTTLASDYSTHKQESYTYTDADLETYYKDNAGTMDTFDFRYALISGQPDVATNEDGTTVEATDAEKTAAMADAKAKAEALAALIEDGGDFNATAAQYVDETAQASYADPEYNHSTAALGESIASSSYGAWITSNDEPRKAGDVGVVEDSAGSSYYVVQVLGRQRVENTYATMDARHILVKAEVDAPAADAAEDAEPITPTEEQYAAAKAKIEKIQAEWEAGDKTAESFGKLADQYSEDPGSNGTTLEDGGFSGGLYEGVTPNQMFTGFNDFLFAPGRVVGDTEIVQNTQADQYGYHLIYVNGLGDIYWKNKADTSLRSTAYTEWYDGVAEGYEATQVVAGMNKLTPKA